VGSIKFIVKNMINLKEKVFMSKSFFAVSLLAITLALGACSATNASSHGESMSSIPDSQSVDERIQLYLLAQTAGFTGTYDEWLDSIQGQDGTSILSGVVHPTADIGNNGDVYIDTMTWDFFVKTDGVWTKVGNIMGPQGNPGQDGSDGTNGSDGVDGLDGEDGLDGLSDYEIYVTYYPGYPGTEFDWINDLASNQLVITIHVDFDDGTPTDVKTTYFKGEAIGPLPTSSKTFYAFSGWSVDDQRIDETYYVISPITLVAQWEHIEVAITNAQELMNIHMNLSGKYVLANDINLMGQEWTPIGSQTNAFTGTLDGKGFTISNLMITETHEYVGLFANNSGTIKNLKLSNVTIGVEGSESSFIYAGSLVARNTGIIENIETSGSMSARTRGGNIGYFGGVIGLHDGTSTIDRLTNRVSLVIPEGTNAGGLIGRLNYANIISNSINHADVYAFLAGVGGLIGQGTNTTINYSKNVGKVQAESSGIGGLIGQGLGTITINHSINRGEVKGTSDVGGFVGEGSNITIRSSMNVGNVSGYAGVGGFVGINELLTIEYSVNVGSIEASFTTDDVGGIIGNPWRVVVLETYHFGSIKSDLVEVAGKNVGTKVLNAATFTVEFFTNTLLWDVNVWDFTGLDIANGVYPTLNDLPSA
jgi:hypothetical protein